LPGTAPSHVGLNSPYFFSLCLTSANPPYMGLGNGNSKLVDYAKEFYPDSKADLFAVFIEKCSRMLVKNRFQAMITQHGWMFLGGYEGLRTKLLDSMRIENMVHLGARAFDEIAGEVVQTTTFVLSNRNLTNAQSTYVRLLAYSGEAEKEKAFICASANKTDIYHVNISRFDDIPTRVIAYWLSDRMFNLFAESKLSECATACKGLDTGDNGKYLRIWYELNSDTIALHANDECKWIPYNKGGGYRRWFGLNGYVINWFNNGFALKYQSKANIRNESYYFREGITWSDLSTNNYAARYCPAGFIFDASGPTMFTDTDKLYLLLGYINSKVYQAVLDVVCPGLHYNNGAIAKTPLPKTVFINRFEQQIKSLVTQSIDSSKSDWDSFEISWDFAEHPLVRCLTVSEAFANWENECAERFDMLKFNEEKINRIFIDLYDMQDELNAEVNDKDVTVRKADLQRDIKSLLSYAVGCMFGRYSLDVPGLAYAGGDWDDSKYSSFVPDKDNILPITDEEYFQDDIVGLFCGWLKKVYGADTLETNLDFIAKALGNKGNTSREVIRNYFLNDFFKDHCSTYSVTGSGKRPIYWLFDSGKQNGFKALIYMHRYDENTIGNLRIDYLHRMERVYESEIARMQDIIDNSHDGREVTKATKRKEKLQKQIKECKEYDEKIAHLALARIPIDLDDGVKVNYEKVQTVDGVKYPVLAKI
jgi:hypothetical protein